jgi:hypothetical protein
MKIKIANSIDILFLITDSTGVAITNLATATAIKFMIKANELDLDLAAKISKTLGSGITINTPSTGNVKVSLTAANTLLPAGRYFMALQIEWTGSVQEVNIKETTDEIVTINTVDFVQDIIR